MHKYSLAYSSSSSSSWMGWRNAGPRELGSWLRRPPCISVGACESNGESWGSGELRPMGDRPDPLPRPLRAVGTTVSPPRFIDAWADILLRYGVESIGESRGENGDDDDEEEGWATCPRPPAYPPPISSSSSTQSESSPMDCLPLNTSRMPLEVGAGETERTSMTGACAVRVCQPGGSKPHDFFQLDRPIECI